MATGYESNPQNKQIQAQVQNGKQTKRQKQMTMYAIDTYNRLSAEIERLISYCSAKTDTGTVNKSFTHFLGEITDNPLSMMINIEGFLSAFDGYNKISKMENTSVPAYPEEYHRDVKYWKNIMAQVENKIEQNPELQLAQEVIKIVLEHFENGTPVLALPEDLSSRILTQNERDRMCREMAENDQSKILGILTIAQNVADETINQLQEMEEKGIEPLANKRHQFNLEDQISQIQSLQNRKDHGKDEFFSEAQQMTATADPISSEMEKSAKQDTKLETTVPGSISFSDECPKPQAKQQEQDNAPNSIENFQDSLQTEYTQENKSNRDGLPSFCKTNFSIETDNKLYTETSSATNCWDHKEEATLANERINESKRCDNTKKLTKEPTCNYRSDDLQPNEDHNHKTAADRSSLLTWTFVVFLIVIMYLREIS